MAVSPSEWPEQSPLQLDAFLKSISAQMGLRARGLGAQSRDPGALPSGAGGWRRGRVLL